MIQVEKHANITKNTIVVNIINSTTKEYIQEILGLSEFNSFLDVLGAKEVKDAEKGVHLPISEHNKFYQQLNL